MKIELVGEDGYCWVCGKPIETGQEVCDKHKKQVKKDIALLMDGSTFPMK